MLHHVTCGYNDQNVSGVWARLYTAFCWAQSLVLVSNHKAKRCIFNESAWISGVLASVIITCLKIHSVHARKATIHLHGTVCQVVIIALLSCHRLLGVSHRLTDAPNDSPPLFSRTASTVLLALWCMKGVPGRAVRHLKPSGVCYAGISWHHRCCLSPS